MPGPVVLFRGPMLTIVNKDRVVEEIRIPNCSCRPGDTHSDGDPKMKHVAGMMIVEPAPDGDGQMEIDRISLLDPSGTAYRVTFDGSTTGECSADHNLEDSIPLNALTDCGATGPTSLRPAPSPGKKNPVAANIFLGAGTFANDGGFVSSEVYDFPSDDASSPIPSHQLPLLKIWTPYAGPISLAVWNAKNERVDQRTLKPDQSVFVYNWDKHEPKNPAKFLEPPGKVCDGFNAVDIDFKWLYQLLTVRGDDWDSWRKGPKLPAPIAQCTRTSRVLRDFRTPGGSDCIDAVWWEKE